VNDERGGAEEGGDAESAAPERREEQEAGSGEGLDLGWSHAVHDANGVPRSKSCYGFSA